jgi:hypothetical protein
VSPEASILISSKPALPRAQPAIVAVIEAVYIPASLPVEKDAQSDSKIKQLEHLMFSSIMISTRTKIAAALSRPRKLGGLKPFSRQTTDKSKMADRTLFQVDLDRLTFSEAFRRLQGKTQVRKDRAEMLWSDSTVALHSSSKDCTIYRQQNPHHPEIAFRAIPGP